MSRRLVIPALFVFLLAGCEQTPATFTLDGQVIVRDGIVYDQKTNQPLNGVGVSYLSDGRLSSRQEFKNGQNDGLREYFFSNGQLAQRDKLKAGETVAGTLQCFGPSGEIQAPVDNREVGNKECPTDVFEEHMQFESAKTNEAVSIPRENANSRPRPALTEQEIRLPNGDIIHCETLLYETNCR
jgi:hypothetical protein